MYRIQTDDVAFTCNAAHLLVVKTPQQVEVVDQVIEGKPYTAVSYFHLSDETIESTNRTVTLVKRGTRFFDQTTGGASEFAEAISQQDIEWTIEARDVELLDQQVLKATRQMISPVLFEDDTLAKRLEKAGASGKVAAEAAYLLGLWVAGGSKDRAQFSTELVDRIAAFGKTMGLETTKTDTCAVLNGKLFWQMVQETGVRSADGSKSVPSSLARESMTVREHFLAGLVDSSGHVLKGRTLAASISTDSASVCGGVIKLARSLGIRATAESST
ncbi:H(+)-transporting V1 sector ATPase subunit A, partial [Linderina pennispora]